MFKEAIVLIICLCSCLSIITGKFYIHWPDTYFHFVTCDVGQGDALLLTFGFTQILIDAGKGDEVLSCLATNMPFWDRTVEMVIITHPDFDHYGGIRGVLERYEVLTLAQLPLKKKDAEFEALQTVIQTKKETGMKVISPIAAEYIMNTDQISIQVVWPTKKSIEKLPVNALLSETLLLDETTVKTETQVDGNPLSITLLVSYKETRFLLTGDIEKESELALIKSPLMTGVDVLKVGHHGSKTSTTVPFLETIRPEIAVISAGENNQYNHPDESVLKNLAQFVGASIYRTDTQGEIHLYTDGTTIWKK